MKLFSMECFINVQGEVKNGWPAELCKEKGAGLQNIVYGISDLRAIAHQPGMISPLWDDISSTVFMNRPERNAKRFIARFNLSTSLSDECPSWMKEIYEYTLQSDQETITVRAGVFYNPMNKQIISFDIRVALIRVIIGQHIDDVVSVF